MHPTHGVISEKARDRFGKSGSQIVCRFPTEICHPGNAKIRHGTKTEGGGALSAGETAEVFWCGRSARSLMRGSIETRSQGVPFCQKPEWEKRGGEAQPLHFEDRHRILKSRRHSDVTAQTYQRSRCVTSVSRQITCLKYIRAQEVDVLILLLYYLLMWPYLLREHFLTCFLYTMNCLKCNFRKSSQC